MTIDQLPTFTVGRLEPDRAIGTFDRALWIGERRLGDLLLRGDRFIEGRFVNVDLPSLSATFVPKATEDVSALQTGLPYPRLDSYWGELAALVLDRKRIWSQRTFEPTDALAYKRPDHTLVGQAADPKLPEPGTLIRGGWDHEHCDICWAKISPRTDSVAMFSEPRHWLCRACYENYVVPRSLGFINVEPTSTRAGEK